MNKINCRDCYVGMTCQYLARRISQHKYNVGSEEKHIALAAHALEEGHTFDFENTKILHFENNRWKRKDFNYTILSYRSILIDD